MLGPALKLVIDKYKDIEIDKSDGEKLDQHAVHIPSDNVIRQFASEHHVPSPKFVFKKDSNFSNNLRALRPIGNRRRSRHTPDPENAENGFANGAHCMYNPTVMNPTHKCRKVSQLHIKPSLSSELVAPFEVVERNYRAQMRRRFLSRSHQCSKVYEALAPELNRPGTSSHQQSGVEQQLRKRSLSNPSLITVAPFEVLERNFRLLEKRRSLPSFSDSVRQTESTTESGLAFPIPWHQTSRNCQSKPAPDWFVPSRASTIIKAPVTVSQAFFNETLRALSEDGTDVGFYGCDINRNEFTNAVSVNMRSEYIIADTTYFTALTSELVSELNLLMETYECTQTTKDRVSRRIIRTKQESNDLVVEIEKHANNESTETTQRYSLDDIGKYLSKGALLVIERIYIIVGAESRFTAHTVDSDGTLCNFSFELLSEQNAKSDSKITSELVTKQTLESPTGYITTTYKYFTTHGQLLSAVQVGLPVIFKTVALPKPLSKTEYLSTPTTAAEDEFHWMDNYMLFSKFTELKEDLKSQYHLYIYNHPEFVDMVKDFLVLVLMEKPQDTLNFAADFFTSYSKRQRGDHAEAIYKNGRLHPWRAMQAIDPNLKRKSPIAYITPRGPKVGLSNMVGGSNGDRARSYPTARYRMDKPLSDPSVAKQSEWCPAD
ncbi:hypothetical protein Aperf_G00000064209 [Anoplocephala perfoliata]